MGEILPDGTIQGYVCGCGAEVGMQGHDCEWRRENEAKIAKRRERCAVCGGFNPGDSSHVRCM